MTLELSANDQLHLQLLVLAASISCCARAETPAEKKSALMWTAIAGIGTAVQMVCESLSAGSSPGA